MPRGIYAHKPHTPETRAKMSKTRKERRIKPPSWKGKHHSGASKQQISNTLTGHAVSEETRNKLRAANLGHKLSDGAKENLSKLWMAEGNPRWKGGITPEIKSQRNSRKFAAWRDKVFERDDYTCRKCLRRGSKLHAHHINNFSQYQELRYEIGNGLTLCENCHIEFHKIFGKQNNSIEQIDLFCNGGMHD